MKVHRIGDPPSLEPAGSSAPPRPRAAAEAVAGHSVHLSEASLGLAQATATSQSFDPAKVEAVKAAMANGTFRVDTGKVADALIAGVADLLARRRP
jgi:negative regulator of flagellin synthesis FlgM